MRTTVLATVLVSILAPAAHAGDYVLRVVDPERPSIARPVKAGTGLAGKLDPPSAALLVPRYEVDTTSPVGVTTLFAVRNITNSPLNINVNYASIENDPLRHDDVVLGPRETYSRNVRDVAGLPADPDGFARGFIAVQVESPLGDSLTGDFLQVDVGNNFATGDRLVRLQDLCDENEIRFLDFGSGTDLTLLINIPQGDDSMMDPPSVVLHVFGEDGAVFPSLAIYTTKNSLVLNTSDLAFPVDFGTLVLDFTNSSGGLAFAEYSAEGKFSVGMNSACLD